MVDFRIQTKLSLDSKYYEIWNQRVNMAISWIALMGREEFPSIKNDDEFDNMVRLGCFDSIPKYRTPNKTDYLTLKFPSTFDFEISFSTRVRGNFGRYGTNSIIEMLLKFLAGMTVEFGSMEINTGKEVTQYGLVGGKFVPISMQNVSYSKGTPVKGMKSDVIIADDPYVETGPVRKKDIAKLKDYFTQSMDKSRFNSVTIVTERDELEAKVPTNEDRLRMVMKGLFDGD